MEGFSVRKAENGYFVEIWGGNPMKDNATYVFDKPTKVVKAVKELLESMTPTKPDTEVPF